VANKKISELIAITTLDANLDVLPIVDISANEVKKITPAFLFSKGLSQQSGNIPLGPNISVNGNTISSNADINLSSANSLILNGLRFPKVDGTQNQYLKTSGNGTLSWSNVAGGSGAVSSVAGRTGDVVLTKTDVSLGNVDNTSDSAKPLSNATITALAGKEPAITKAQGFLTWSVAGNAWVSINASYQPANDNLNAVTQANVTNWNSAFSWGNHANVGYLTRLRNDTSPSLGGNLNVTGFDITSNANSNVNIYPGSGGRLRLANVAFPVTDGTVNQALRTGGNGQLFWSNTATVGVDAQKIITYGTTVPTGGLDGDIYLQYTP